MKNPARPPVHITPFGGPSEAWGAALAGVSPEGAALQQSPAYGAIAQAAGRGLRRFNIAQGGTEIGLAQLVGRGGLWLLNRGPVLRPDLRADPALHLAVLRALARRVPGVLLATPEAGVAGFGFVPLITPRHHAVWDITPPEATLRAGLAGKWRNRLAAAERRALRVAQTDNPDWLIAAEAGQRVARGYRGLPAGFVAAWGAAAGSAVPAPAPEPAAVLTLAALADDGTRLAGVLLLRHGAGASYHLGWASDAGRALGAHNLLLWQAALRLAAQGVRQLDLGDVNSEAGAGLMHFKLGTGAAVRRLGATGLVLPG